MEHEEKRGDMNDFKVLSNQMGDGSIYLNGGNLKRNRFELRKKKIIQ